MKSLKEQVKLNCQPRNRLLDDDNAQTSNISNIEIKPSLPDINKAAASQKNLRLQQKNIRGGGLSASQ